MKSSKKINNITPQPRILIAPLDWGLGHATRCIPIISELLHHNCKVFIAAKGATALLLQHEFPEQPFLSLTGYRIKYSRIKYFLGWKICKQIPKILLSIYREHQWLKKTVKENKIDVVISDNRFGMYHKRIRSVYITHQLLIKTGNTFIERIVQRIHYFFIKKYNECWVPDFQVNGLAGELSHPKILPGKIKYLGALSRFELNDTEKKYDLLISISGPEPQRTIFENQILNELATYAGRVLFIRGMPENKEEIKSENPLVEIKNHLSSEQLNEAILQSPMIVSRCGYTTVMDLVKLKKKSILVPTPEQTEQEYLAKYLMGNKIFYTISQKDFVLQNALQDANSFSFSVQEYNMDQYKNVVEQFVRSL